MTASAIILVCLIAASGFLLLLTRRDSQLALALFLFLLPSYLVRTAIPAIGFLPSIPTTALELLFFGLTIGWLWRGDWRKSPGILNHWAWPLFLILLAGLFGTVIAPDLRAAFGLLRAYILEPLVLFIIVATTVSDIRGRRLIMGALGISLASVGAFCAFQKFTGYAIPDVWLAERGRRVTGPYGFPNAVGLFVGPLTLMMLGWTVGLFRQFSDWRHRVLALLPFTAAVLGCLAIIFAVSEGAAIGLAAGLLVCGLTCRPTRIAALTGLIAACLLIISVQPILSYVTAKADLTDDSGSVRKVVWTESLAMLREHPIFGAGLSGYPVALVPYHKSDWVEIFQYPHDFILNVWSELGVLGLLAFGWIFVRFFRDTVRLAAGYPDEWLPPTLLGVMTVILVHGLVDVPYFKNDLAMLFWTIVGLTESLRLHQLTAQRPLAGAAQS